MPSVSEVWAVHEAADVLRHATEQGSTVSIERDGGDIVLSMRRLDQVLEHEAGDLTATVEAGVRIDDLNVDVLPEGHLLVFTNIDRPGVVGFIGTVLGENKVNIATFQVGRKAAGGEAVSILNVDSPVSADIVKKIRNFSGITSVWVVDLK